MKTRYSKSPTRKWLVGATANILRMSNGLMGGFITLIKYQRAEPILFWQGRYGNSKHEKTYKMFPINIQKHDMNTRNPEQFKVQFSRTARLKNSSVIFMQNALNKQC